VGRSAAVRSALSTRHVDHRASCDGDSVRMIAQLAIGVRRARGSPGSAELLEDLGNVASAVQHRDDGQRISGRPVHDQIGIDTPELQRTVGQIVTRVANAWPRRQQDERLLEREPTFIAASTL
jgi:hypothetical protein